MPDETYDAIVIGGGNKGLACAMYLQRYGGMSVGVFERRHEAGGGWATEESAAPGFLANTHAQMIYLWLHYLPVQRDFPEFDGANLDMYVISDGAIFNDTHKCLGIYSVKHDPSQERTAREIARFSKQDAEMWLKGWDLREMFLKNIIAAVNTPPAEFEMLMMQRLPEMVGGLIGKGIELELIYTMYSPLRANKEAWESKELQSILVRLLLSLGIEVTQPRGQMTLPVMWASLVPYMCFHVGGTHQAAHACHKILIGDGAKIWTHCEVDKVIIENGTAKGIRLTDGREIGARKLVVSTLSPQQLCFDLIGKEHLTPRIVRRIELLESKHTTISWYNWALHEYPMYTAADFNPDINQAFWLGLQQVTDPDTIARETYWRRLGKMPPLEDMNPVVWGHGRVDPSYAPPGKAMASHENFMPPASALSEREWLKLKKQHAEDMIRLWQTFAPNMTWDNVIGVATDTPYDCCRLKNMAPEGNWQVIDNVAHQTGKFRPIPELSEHRTPIKNLYAAGTGFSGDGASASGGYRCYKIIAQDMDLPKPWLEPGKEEPDSLYNIMVSQEKALQQKAKKEAK